MKWNIQKRLLVLVLAAGILSFLTWSSLSFYGISVMRSEMTELGDTVGKAGADFTESLMTYQLKRTLGELATARAEFIDHQMDLFRQDVQMLANMMTRIVSNPDDYKPLLLRDPRLGDVHNFEPYVIYSPETYLNGSTPETLPDDLRREIGIASNIGNSLQALSKSFAEYKSSFNVGLSKGYFLAVTVYPEVSGALPFGVDDIYHYDCRERPWYKNAVNADAPVFSDIFTNNDDVDHYQAISCSAPYYDRTGVAGVVSIGLSISEIYEAIEDTAVGANGFSFVLNQRGEVILSTRTTGDLVAATGGQDLRESSNESLAHAARKMADGQSGIFPVTVDGEEYFLAFAPMKHIGWSFATLTPRKDIAAAAEDSRNYFLAQVESFGSRLQDRLFMMTFCATLLLTGLLYLMFTASRKLSARFVKPIHELSDGVRDISSGNLDKKLDIQTGDELEHLATCFNAMTDELKTYMENLTHVTAEKERIATELDVATEIQRGMLPTDFPTREDVELFATMTPAKEVGGDFYDFYWPDETHLAITVADVSGKGIPAALFMVIAKTVLNNFAVSKHNSEGLAEVVAAANDELCANNEAMMFVTAFIGVLDVATGEFVYVNAGHNPPVLYRAETNRCDFLDVKKNFVLGPMDGIPFTEQRVTLAKGDLIFLYTDGVTEALNVSKEEYLPERLLAFMNTINCREDLQTLLKAVRDDVAAHVGDAEQSDDITMFALRFKK